MIGALALPMFWACSADGRGAVPLPKPRPADAPGVQDSRGAPREKNNLPDEGRPEAESDEGDEQKAERKAAEKATHQKAAEPKPSPFPSPCRVALTEAIAIAPSIPPIRGPGACGGEDLVRLEAVVLAGGKRVPMKPAAILRCAMASAVADWVRTDMAALADKLGSPLSEVDNFDSFECRGRNRINGAKLSEHGLANALDVRGVKLASGKFISLTDRTEPREVREQVLQSVCKRFSTVLGPGSDWYHEDHIHLDLAERRGNYRICQWNVYDPLPAVAPLLPAERPEEAPPREVAGAESTNGHPSARAQQPQAQQQPEAQQQPQAPEPEATEPEPAAPTAAKPSPSSKASKAKAAKSKSAKSKTPEVAPPAAAAPPASASPQPETAEPPPAAPSAAASTTAEPQSTEPTAAPPEATPKPAAKSPPPTKKKRKHRRQQPNFFGLPLPKF